MATTATGTRSTSRKEAQVSGGPKPPGPNGRGPGENGWRQKGEGNQRRKFSPAAYRIAMWVLLAAIVMMFAALSSAYIVLSGGEEWASIAVPRMFFWSTSAIVVSSATFEVARRYLKDGRQRQYAQWLAVTLLFGLTFLVTQLMAWRELRAQGIYLASNPHSSFFYLFTGVHGAHVLGGIIALLFLVVRSRNTYELGTPRSQASASVVSLYWHVMDAVWIWLLLLLLVWR
ncbi:MAG: heme-copper oxidase subunit III [Pyrinomonadaceae bacterium]|nr:heme-copper oxidase subunit III [Pyrinomonadaceae bacterium]